MTTIHPALPTGDDMTSKATGRTCRATDRQERITWACTRPEGHAGQHGAQGINGVTLHRWKKVAR